MDFFCFSVCHVCKRACTKLKKCARCRVVHYCSRAHQVKDWGHHRDYCKVITESRARSSFPPGAGAESFNDFKFQQGIVWQLELGRPMEVFEHEMWMFPKVCTICYSSDAKKVCQKCWGVAYCNNHGNSDDENHEKFCEALKLCLEIQQTVHAEGYSAPWTRMKFQFSEEIQALPETFEGVLKMLNLDFSGNPIEFALATDYFCTLVNVLLALESSKFLKKRDGRRTKLTVHVTTTELNENLDWPQFMEFLSHWITNLKNLQIFVVAPEKEVGEHQWFRPDCEQCKKKHFKGCVTFLRGDYTDYVEDIPCPDVVLALHSILPEYGTCEWQETIPKLLSAKRAPVVITGATKLDLESKLKSLPEESIKFYLKPQENKYRSRRPVRNIEAGGEPLVYRYRFIAIVAKK